MYKGLKIFQNLFMVTTAEKIETNPTDKQIETDKINPVKGRLSYLKSLLRFYHTKEGYDSTKELVIESVHFLSVDEDVKAVVHDLSPRELARLMLNWRGNMPSFRNVVRRSLDAKRRCLLTEEEVIINPFDRLKL